MSQYCHGGHDARFQSCVGKRNRASVTGGKGPATQTLYGVYAADNSSGQNAHAEERRLYRMHRAVTERCWYVHAASGPTNARAWHVVRVCCATHHLQRPPDDPCQHVAVVQAAAVLVGQLHKVGQGVVRQHLWAEPRGGSRGKNEQRGMQDEGKDEGE